ncbi:MAG: ROK family protein [Clostridia bacterium]|nr:ROK family protein [Clostridia bacterium]
MIYAGVDLGGTNIAVGIVNEHGDILARTSTPTRPERDYKEIAQDMLLCIYKTLKECGRDANDLESVGVGIPGIANPKDGTIIYCTNLGWRDVPLNKELQKYLPKPVFIDNDATVAGYAESISGISKGCDSSVFITLGTGVGAGIVIHGRPWSGFHGVGSELGHITVAMDGVPCTCGNNGCLERYCSATAIIRMARQEVLSYPESQMLSLVNGDPEQISARTVFDAAKNGDKAAVRIYQRYVNYLAIGINNVISFLDPEMIVIGGGVSAAGSFLLDGIRECLPRYLMYKTVANPRIELATLGNEAGIIGAALLGKV